MVQSTKRKALGVCTRTIPFFIVLCGLAWASYSLFEHSAKNCNLMACLTYKDLS